MRTCDELGQMNFTVFDPAEGEDTYFFRNMITRSVIYDSLLHKMPHRVA